MKSFKQIREAKSSSGYDLYHKDFSGAMQHAYAHAKKKGYVVSTDDIDNKVASGPKKPSSGKTNKYILSTQKKNRNVHIQVANLDNKRYELNMYIESAMVEGKKPVSQMTPAEKKKDAARRKEYNAYQKSKRNEEVLDEAMGRLNAKGEIEMTAKNYAKIHKDYKTKMKGVPYAMQIDPKTGGSALYPVKIIKESLEEAFKPAINEALKTTHVVIDTADGNKIVSSATNEKQAKSSIVSAERPPMNIKDKKTLKVVQLKKPVSLNKDILGTVFKESVEESIELEEALKNVRGKDGKTYTLDFDMSGRKITVRTKNQFGDIKTISMKQAAKLFEDSILESAKRDAFRAMDKRGKDSADDDDVKATADDRKAADKNIIVQLRRVADLSKGGVIEFKNGKKVNLKQNLAKAVLMKYNTIKRNDQKLKFADLASQSPQDLQKALKLK